MSVDLRKIKKLIELLEQSDLNELEIIEGDNCIRLNRGGSAVVPPVQYASAPQPAVAAAAPAPAASTDSAPASGATPSGNEKTVHSPLVATYYSAPSPDADDYVKVGDTVKVGDVLCILEAMKTFNQLESEVAGKVVEIRKTSGDPVEFGEPLFVIE